ncbi:MAG: hypothetical protein M1401_02640 [Chloroflexi bacterium]|nr:hypothetical protein [Chloroflexota bacterium]MCL5107772.1 hypothetical protein [Chloroflexota bacterium]
MTRRKFLVSGAAGLLLLLGGAVSVGAAPVAQVGTLGAGQAANVAQGGPRWGGSKSVAQILGIDQAQLRAERQAGKSLAQIAQEKNVDEATLIDKIIAQRQAQLDQLVTDGKLTQEQQNLMLERMQTQVKTAVERTEVGPMGPADGTGLGLGLGRQGAGYRFQAQPESATPGQGLGARTGGFGPAFNR